MGQQASQRFDFGNLKHAAIACCGLRDDIADGIEIARRSIDDGSALDRLCLLQDVAKR